METAAVITLNITQPITETLLEQQSRYLEYKRSGEYTRAHAIVETIRDILRDLRYTAEFNEAYDRAHNAAANGQDMLFVDKLFSESDLVADRCYLYAIAIARKNELIGPNFTFRLLRSTDCADRFGIELTQLKNETGLRMRRQEDTDKLYLDAMEELLVN